VVARLFLLPGLGADERMFGGLDLPCAEVLPVRLPPPRARESMPRYALRVASGLGMRPEDWLGGSSFGSLVAADIARRRPVRGLVLIGGGLSAESFVRPLRWFGAIGRILPIHRLHPLLATRVALRFVFGTLSAPHMRLLNDMMIAAPDALLREGVRLAIGYRPAPPVLCPVHAIHGEHDRLMRPPPVADCSIVPGAGHALALTHHDEVTEFLRGLVCC
jgi:pimeloyl-ACP methyl ester carboxylesterase